MVSWKVTVIPPEEPQAVRDRDLVGRKGAHVGGRRPVLNTTAQRVAERQAQGDPRGSEVVQAVDDGLADPVAEDETIPTSAEDVYAGERRSLKESDSAAGGAATDPLDGRPRLYSLAEVRALVEGYAVLRQQVL